MRVVFGSAFQPQAFGAAWEEIRQLCLPPQAG
jgi:hypothetical protein